MANPSYINRFIDIIRSPMGRPLLNQLAASSQQLAALIHIPPERAEGAVEPPPQVRLFTEERIPCVIQRVAGCGMSCRQQCRQCLLLL
jgi:hypothetical protein